MELTACPPDTDVRVGAFPTCAKEDLKVSGVAEPAMWRSVVCPTCYVQPGGHAAVSRGGREADCAATTGSVLLTRELHVRRAQSFLLCGVRAEALALWH